jgi:hypothetical protein
MYCVLFGLFFNNQVMAEICADTSIPPSNTVKKFKFIHSFDGKKSFISSQKASVFGFKLGLQYKNKFRTGLGLYFQGEPATENYTFNEGATRTVAAKLDFTYLTLFYEPIVFKNKRWELSVPTQLGIGTAQLSYIDSTQAIPQKTIIYSKSAGVTEVVFMAEYKLFRWIGFGSGVGLRAMITEDEVIKKSLNSPIYVFKVRILFGELYKMAFKEKKEGKAKKDKAKE